MIKFKQSIALALCAVAVSFAALAPRKAEASPGLLVIISVGAVIAQLEAQAILDTTIARAFDDDLVLRKRAFDKSQWPYQVSDDRKKNVSYAFQTEEAGRAFMDAWAEKKRREGANATAPAAF